MPKHFRRKKPYKKGFLSVGGCHRLYFEIVGNPKGKPVLFLHGGPGSGFSEKSKRFFNFKKLSVIFFDQRGAGKSKPKGGLRGNTSQNLVGDIRKLLSRLGIKKVFLFGGSWGSTLALLYAIKYPKTVSGMLLRGIFLASPPDIKYFIDGPVRKMFPAQRERFLRIVPEKQRKNAIAYYAKQIQSKSKKTRELFSFEWAYYEDSIMQMRTTDAEVRKKLKERDYRQWVKIESQYMAKNCFLPEGFILRNAGKLSGIPTTIIHGKFDAVCSPDGARRLHSKIKGSRLCIVASGHSAFEKEPERKLVAEMEKARKTIKW